MKVADRSPITTMELSSLSWITAVLLNPSLVQPDIVTASYRWNALPIPVQAILTIVEPAVVKENVAVADCVQVTSRGVTVPSAVLYMILSGQITI